MILSFNRDEIRDALTRSKIPAGSYQAVIDASGSNEIVGDPSNPRYPFTFRIAYYDDNGELVERSVRQNLFPNQILRMFYALNGRAPEEGEQIDTVADFHNRTVGITLYYQKDKNNPGREYLRIGEFFPAEDVELNG